MMSKASVREELGMKRYFTKDGKTPKINYVKTDIKITDSAGKNYYSKRF